MLHIAQNSRLFGKLAADYSDGPTQVSIYNGKGILTESRDGPVWMYGTASEHSVLYQYNFANTKNPIIVLIPIATPHYQLYNSVKSPDLIIPFSSTSRPYPPAPAPFHTDAKFSDPDYSYCAANSKTNPMAYGQIIKNSENNLVYAYLPDSITTS